MMSRFRLRRPFMFLVAVALSALLLPMWPPAPAGALEDETGSDQLVDNTQADFADGVFQRTVVSAAPESPNAPDVIGAIELAPVGVLNRNNWRQSVAQLPQPLSDAPVVALGRYLFVIGGATSPTLNEANRSPYIYRGVVNQVSGAFELRSRDSSSNDPGNDYFSATFIPEVYPGPECASNVRMSGRSRAGAVAVPATTGSNLGYIFIVGGSMYNQNCQLYDFSTNIVQRATVDADGNIVSGGWSAPNNWRFPTLDGNGNIITDYNSSELRGVQNVQLVHIRTSAGKDFIYAIGGLSVSAEALQRQLVYPHVFYTQVNANGDLVHPTNPSSATVWAKLSDLPFSLHSGTAIAAYATRVENGTPVQKEAIFLLGGCRDALCNTLNTAIWRADVNAVTGTLSWTNLVGRTSTAPISVDIQGRQGVTGLSFNNRIYYVTGSTATGSPGASGATATIPVAIYNDQFLLEDLTGGRIYVVGTNETNDYVLPLPNRRLNASVTIVPATPPDDGTTQVNAAWIYIVGGSNEQNQPTSTIFFGGVGGANEAGGIERSSEGWYYSKPFSVLSGGATSRLLAIKWLTDLNRPTTNPEADIRLQFRAVVTSGTCRESDFNPSTDPSNPSRWRDLDGDPNSDLRSRHGLNVVRFINVFQNEEIQATCMQYRAQFIQDPGSRSFSPKLYYVAVEKIMAAKPDILIDTFEVRTDGGRFSTIELTLRNLRQNNLAATRSAAVPEGGGFFVDLCIVRRSDPNIPALAAMPEPNPNANSGDLPPCPSGSIIVSAQVPKERLEAGATYGVPFNDWMNTLASQRPNWSAIFGTPGTYDIGIVVDYNGLVREDTEGRRNNRGEDKSPPNGIIRTITITAAPTPTTTPLPQPSQRIVFVPVIYR